MAYQKVVPYLIIAVVAIVISTQQVSSAPKALNFYAANNTNRTHDLVVGARRPGDKLVVNEVVRNTTAWVITQQKRYMLQRGQRITLIRAMDRGYNGTGGYARISNGGPGWNNVTLEFRGQRGIGFDFLVMIYAY